MHYQGLDEHPKKNSLFKSESKSPKKNSPIAYENHWNMGKGRRMRTFELIWPWILVGLDIRGNLLNNQGHDGRPKKISSFWTSKSGSLKKWCVIAQQNCQNGVMHTSGVVWTLKWVGHAVRINQMHSQGNMDIHKIIRHCWCRTLDYQKMVCYSIHKYSKWGVCTICGLFDLENGSNLLWGPIGWTSMVLTDVNIKFWHF